MRTTKMPDMRGNDYTTDVTRLDQFGTPAESDPPPTRAAERPVEHTPTPWEVGTDHIDYVDVQPAGNKFFTIAKVSGFDKAEARDNAKLIVEAVNNHTTLLRQKRKLVEALQLALIHGLHSYGCPITNYRKPCTCWKQTAETALNAAVGEGEGGR